MTLQELKDKLQNLCYQGYSQYKVFSVDDDNRYHKINSIITVIQKSGKKLVIDLSED